MRACRCRVFCHCSVGVVHYFVNLMCFVSFSTSLRISFLLLIMYFFFDIIEIKKKKGGSPYFFQRPGEGHIFSILGRPTSFAMQFNLIWNFKIFFNHGEEKVGIKVSKSMQSGAC